MIFKGSRCCQKLKKMNLLIVNIRVSSVCKSVCFHIRAFRLHTHCVHPEETVKSVGLTLISFHVDYANSVSIQYTYDCNFTNP